MMLDDGRRNHRYTILCAFGLDELIIKVTLSEPMPS